MSQVTMSESEVTTPESNPNYDVQISDKTKQRARATDPNGGRCLVSNQATIVDCSHCLSRCQMKNDDMVCVYRSHHYLFRLQMHIIAHIP